MVHVALMREVVVSYCDSKQINKLCVDKYLGCMPVQAALGNTKMQTVDPIHCIVYDDRSRAPDIECIGW